MVYHQLVGADGDRRLFDGPRGGRGIRNAKDVATCLAGYDDTMFPPKTSWSFTRFYLQQAVDTGYRLSADAQVLWDAFVAIHNKSGLGGRLEIPMESFARAVEIVLKESELRDAPNFHPSAELWMQAVRSSGYVQTRVAVGRSLFDLSKVA